MIFLVSDVFAQTTISGGEVSGTWTKLLSPYLIERTITIPNDSTLIIEPGVIVEFQGHYALQVQGRLLAQGTEEDTILFTVNDTLGFSNPDTTLGGWYGIRFIDTPTENDSSRIQFCRLQYGKAVAPVWHLNAGGAICAITFGKIAISNCLLTHNIAGGLDSEVPSGGAVHLAWSDVRFNETTFTNNYAKNGGAIQYHESNPTFINCNFMLNKAENGGAITGDWKSVATFINCNVINNHAEIEAGGIKLGELTNNILNNVTISNNTAESGAGIHGYKCDIKVLDCTFDNNIASGLGGGISMAFCVLYVDNSDFIKNRGFGSGGIHAWQSFLHVLNSKIEDNSATELSGGVHADFTEMTIENSNINNNTAGTGGGLSSWYSDIHLLNGTIWGNQAGLGGGIYAHNSKLVIDSCDFVSNKATESDAGAIHYSADSTIFGQPYKVEFVQSSFTNNSALGNSGAVRIEQYNSDLSLIDVIVNGCKFTNNQANVFGSFRISGNIFDFIVANSMFSGNKARQRVAGAAFITGCVGKIYNCIFSSNYTAFSDTTALSSNATVAFGSNADFFNCTFVDTSDVGGYGISLRRDGTGTLTNCIIWGCGDHPISIATAAEQGAEAYVNYCNIENGRDSIFVSDSLSALHWGINNISQEPQFVNVENGDFHLSDTSPCIGAGVNCFKLNDVWHCAPEFDLEGNIRPNPDGSNVDMGAYENSLSVPTAIENRTGKIPDQFKLSQNYPNPFNPKTVISWQLAVGSKVELNVYNLIGQKIVTLLSEYQAAGKYNVEWYAQGFASGIYIYRIQTETWRDMKKMILIK